MRMIRTVAFAVILTALSAVPGGGTPVSSKVEDSYSIDLVKTAEPVGNVWDLDGRRVSGEIYTFRKGDYIYKILRDRGFSEGRGMAETLEVLKELNPSLSDLDLVHPGQKLLIPLKIEQIETTEAGGRRPVKTVSGPPAEVGPLPELSDMDVTRYTVRRGESLVKIIRDHNDIPHDVLYGPYMDVLRDLNPSLEDIDTIRPGQVIRLPIFSPGAVTGPIVRPGAEPLTEGAVETGASDRGDGRRLWADISRIFTEVGEECIQSGAHFIPLVSGGQIDLKAEVFPLLVLRHGVTVVVDINGMLPGRIRTLIESGWGMYRVVDLTGVHSLDAAIGRVLDAAGYPGVRRAGEPLRVNADFPFVVRGDWIFSMGAEPGGATPRTAVVSLCPDTATPRGVKDYLRDRGVVLVEHPLSKAANAGPGGSVRVAAAPLSLVAEVLDLAGQPFAGGVQIPAYQSSSAGLRLVIDADFYLQVNGRDAVIDLRGLPPEIVSFLNENRFMVLPLSGVTDGVAAAEKVLRFIEVPSGSFPEHCIAGLGVEGNVEVSVRGACFDAGEAGTVLVISSPLPAQLEPLFARRNVTVLSIAF